MSVVIEGKEYTESEFITLAKAGVLHIGQKNNPGSTTIDAPTLQGAFPGNVNQYGIFSGPGVRPQRYSALARPRSFLSLVSMTPSEYEAELIEIMTGQTAGAGNNSSDWCGDAPTAGQLKTCQQIFKYGDFAMRTRLNPLPLTGHLRNISDIPGEVLNSGPSENPFIPEMMFNLRDTRSQLALELFNIGVEIGRQMELVAMNGVYTGSQSNTYRGFWHQFTGLDAQIKTGYQDQGSPAHPDCPAADSAVISFNAAINSTDANGQNIVQAAHDMYWGLRYRAEQVGMSGVNWAIVMRPEQFRAMTEVWACQYATYRCQSTNAGQPFVNDVLNTNALRLEMMNGQYLLIDGQAVPVVFSEGIPNPAIANNTYEADFYFVAFNWNGSPLLRMEYFNLANPYAREYASFVDPQNTMVLNNGLYLVSKSYQGSCMQYKFDARFRMIVETPFLCGRIDNVNYSFLAPVREAIPGTSFYQNGGSTYRTTYITT